MATWLEAGRVKGKTRRGTVVLRLWWFSPFDVTNVARYYRLRDPLVSLAGDREGLARGAVEETANGYPAGRPKETTNAEQRTNSPGPPGSAEQSARGATWRPGRAAQHPYQ